MARISAIYCHIPFCHTICPFCAFAVHGNRKGLHGSYLDALKTEIADAARDYAGARQHIECLYFGGGTPSTLAIEDVQRLLGHIDSHFPLASGVEIAFEVNPEDASPQYLKALLRAGINRISLGLQSLDDTTLQILKRNHNAHTGAQALEALRNAAPDNYNVDLMFGIPHAPEGAFAADLEAIQALRPPHLSLYALDVEPGTLFSRDVLVQQWMATHGASQAEKYLLACELMTGMGYRHYEVSNFCLPGREGRQNLAVWDGEYYLGFGTGAHSFVDGERWHNHRHLRAYQRAMETGQAPRDFHEKLTQRQMANEALMLALRQEAGLEVAAWEKRWQTAWGDSRQAVADRMVADGKASWREGRLALTPEGFLVADEATALLMLD